MTATAEEWASVEDYTHPEWCSLSLCEPSRGIHVANRGLPLLDAGRLGGTEHETASTPPEPRAGRFTISTPPLTQTTPGPDESGRGSS